MEINKLDDLYDILDVDFGCSDEEVIESYKIKINEFHKLLYSKKKLNELDKKKIKNIKIAKYILLDSKLRKMYNLSKIIDDSDENNQDDKKLNYFEYNELKEDLSLAKKDKPVNYDLLSDRQFERYDHNSFDLTKDREIRGAYVEKKIKNT